MRVVLLSLLCWSCVTTTTRKIVFDPSKLTISSENFHAEGAVDLNVSLKGANPLCAAYQLKLSSVTYTPQPALPMVGGAAVPQGGTKTISPYADACDTKSGVERGRCSIEKAAELAVTLSDLESKLRGWQRDLSAVWGQCDANAASALAAQVTTIMNLKGKVYEVTLDTILAQTAFASSSLFATTKALKQDLARIEADLIYRKTAAARSKQQLDLAIERKAPAKEIESLRAAAIAAEDAVDQVQASFEQLDTVIGIGAEWSEQLGKTQLAVKSTLDTLRNDVAAALALIPPGASNGEVQLARQVFEPGQQVTVEVIETKRVGGKLVEKGGERSLGAISIAVLRPIRFDVGVGPAVALKWDRSYGVSDKNTVIETEKKPDLDGIVTFSMYYTPRYLDGKPYKAVSWLPRPMFGLSLRNPSSAVYLGVQLDPIQFLDISLGAKLHSKTELVDANIGEMVAVDDEGNAIPPATRSNVDTALFISLTASSGLFTSWITSLAK